MDLWTALSMLHLLGLTLGLGAASVKVMLLLRCWADPASLPTFMQVARPITRMLIAGLILLTGSGAAWVALGVELTPLLWAKLAVVAMVWTVGPVIDNVAEPRLRALAEAPGGLEDPALPATQRRHLRLELLATALFYAAFVIGTLL